SVETRGLARADLEAMPVADPLAVELGDGALVTDRLGQAGAVQLEAPVLERVAEALLGAADGQRDELGAVDFPHAVRLGEPEGAVGAQLEHRVGIADHRPTAEQRRLRPYL